MSARRMGAVIGIALMLLVVGCEAIGNVVQGGECDQLRQVEKEWRGDYFGSGAHMARPYPNSVWMEIDEVWDDGEGAYLYTLTQSFGLWSNKSDVEYPEQYADLSQAQKVGDTLCCSRYTNQVHVLPTREEWVVIMDGEIVDGASTEVVAEQMAAEFRLSWQKRLAPPKSDPNAPGRRDVVGLLGRGLLKVRRAPIRLRARIVEAMVGPTVPCPQTTNSLRSASRAPVRFE